MHVRFSLALAATVALASASARADDAAHAEAKRRMAEGSAYYNQGNFDEARLRFAEACTLLHTFNCIRSLAAAEYRSSHFVEAFDHLSEAIDDTKFSTLQADTQRQFAIMRADALKQTGHLEISAPDGATLFVDGALVGAAPLSHEVTTTPGRHVVEAKTTAGTLHTEPDALGGQFTPVQLRLPDNAEPARSTPSEPPSPATPPPVPPEPAVHLPAAEPLGFEQPPFWSSRRVVGVLVAGAGVASVLTGVGFGIAAQHDADQAGTIRNTIGANDTASNCAGTPSSFACQDLLSARNAQAQHHALNLAFLGVGAAGVVLGAALFFWPSPRASRTAVLPMLTPQFGGVVLRGSL